MEQIPDMVPESSEKEEKMNKTCKTCIDNDDGLCDRKGILVEDEDHCDRYRESEKPRMKKHEKEAGHHTRAGTSGIQHTDPVLQRTAGKRRRDMQQLHPVPALPRDNRSSSGRLDNTEISISGRKHNLLSERWKGAAERICQTRGCRETL